MKSVYDAQNSQLPPTHAGQLLRDFVDAFDSVQEQLKTGTTPAIVPLTKISLLGTEGVAILKKHLEDATNARFVFSVNASTNSVVLMPTGPMPPKATLTAQSLASPAANASKTAAPKVPRPPNAFIIYRKDWHSKVVAQNPGLHNNAISVIIGEKWRAEKDHIRAAYTQKAEDAKRQHLAKNPGYQYQPRKPSEKKQRMTKNKLAKLAAKAEENGNILGDIVQQPLPDDFDPVSMLDEHLGSCTNGRSLNINAYEQVPIQQQPVLESSRPQFIDFTAGPDADGLLATSLQAFNDAHPNSFSAPNGATVFVAQSTINDVRLDPRFVDTDLPGVGYYDAAVNSVAQEGHDESTQQQVAVSTAGTSANYNQCNTQVAAPATMSVAPDFSTAEVVRQDQLDFDFDKFIDVEAYGSSPAQNGAGPADADITFDFNAADFANFGGNYQLEF